MKYLSITLLLLFSACFYNVEASKTDSVRDLVSAASEIVAEADDAGITDDKIEALRTALEGVE